jgi:hypothetical protein
LALSLGLLAAPSFAVETVTVLDRGEPFDSMVASNGILWVGQSRINFKPSYKLRAFQTNGKLIDEVTLSHSLNTLKDAGNGAVISTGTSPQSQLTRYTVAKVEGGKIRFTTKEIALGGFITFWISSFGGRHYFADMGGNPNDPWDPGQPRPAAQTIFTSTGTNANYLSARVRMPVAGTSLNGKLLLVSSDGIGVDGTSLVEVDPRTSAVRVISKSQTAKYRGIEILPGSTNIVTSAWSESKVRVIDSSTGEIRREFATNGYPRSFVLIDQCIVVGNDETNVVEVFSLKGESSTPIMTANVGLDATEFSGIRSIAVDQASGNVFARSSNACNPMATNCDHDNNRVVKFDQALSSQIKASCN